MKTFACVAGMGAAMFSPFLLCLIGWPEPDNVRPADRMVLWGGAGLVAVMWAALSVRMTRDINRAKDTRPLPER